jgi:hypothetical protein
VYLILHGQANYDQLISIIWSAPFFSLHACMFVQINHRCLLVTREPVAISTCFMLHIQLVCEGDNMMLVMHTVQELNPKRPWRSTCRVMKGRESDGLGSCIPLPTILSYAHSLVFAMYFVWSCNNCVLLGL